MSNNIWLNTTVTRSTSVVPVVAGGLAHVCPDAAFAGTPMRTRQGVALKATHKVQGFHSWSPPIT